MVCISKFVLFSVGASASLIGRALPQVVADLQQADSRVQNATAYTNNYNATIKGWIPIQQNINFILDLFRAADSDARNSPVGSDRDSAALVNYVNDQLGPDVGKFVNAVIAQKQGFQNSGLEPVFRQNGLYLRGNWTTLRNDAVTKVSSASRASASAVFDGVTSQWQRFVDAYP